MAKNKGNTILNQFDGIVVIPIKGNEPVLIFKNLGKPFFEDYLDGSIEDGEPCITGGEIISDFLVSWKGELLGHSFPKAVEHQYGNFFTRFLSNPYPYDTVELPRQVIELPLKLAIGDKELKVVSPKYITPVRNALRKIGLLKESRGKFKKEDINKKERDKKIIAIYREIVEKTKKKRPYPINIIFKRLTDYDVSFATIRRALDSYTKK